MDLKTMIKAERISEDKAMCFLDLKIYHDISKGDFRSFDVLLNVMKKKDFRSLNCLAEKINIALIAEPIASNTEG